MLRFVQRPVLAIAASFCVASCLCNPVPSPGCDFSYDPYSCDLDAAVSHGKLANGYSGSCFVACDPGWDDCDGILSNGCEFVGSCPVGKDSGVDAGGGAERLGTLQDAPMGLAVCDDHVYVVVGGDRIFDFSGDGGSNELVVLPTPAAGGIACLRGELFFGLRTDGVLPGSVIRRDVDGSVSSLSDNVDPGRGIDVDDAGTVVWPSRDDAGLVLTRTDLDGSTALGPVDEVTVTWPFARGAKAIYALNAGALVDLSGDAQAPIVGPDASLVAVAAGDGVSLLALDDASASFHVLEDGGMGASLASLPSARAMVRYGVDTYVATDEAIFRLADDGTKIMIMNGQLHIVDLVVLGPWAYWTTLGDGVTPPSVYRVKR